MKQNILAGFCWLVIIGLLVAGLMACGLFKKNVKKDYGRVVTEKSDQSVIRDEKKEESVFKEQDVLEIEIRIPRKKDRVAPDTTDYKTLNKAIISAIQDAEHLSLRLSALKEESRTEGQKRGENRDRTIKVDSLDKSKVSNIEGNTSMLANIPSFVWWIVVPVLLLFLYLALKKWQVV